MDSIEAARTWRARWVKPTMHAHATHNAPQPQPSQTPLGALESANASMLQAGQFLAAGKSIDALLPSLRQALAEVPEQRRERVRLYPGVMEVLIDEEFDAILQHGADGIDSDFYRHAVSIALLHEGEGMRREDASYLHWLWYQVAIGQIFAKSMQQSQGAGDK